MSSPEISTPSALESLRDFLADQKLALNARLPAERQLCSELGLSRGKLRKALALLEAEGQIWRHVGRGTFIGPRPVINLNDVEYLSEQSRPTEVMEARMAIEPQLAKLAAVHGTASNFAEMRRCQKRCHSAREWRVYEAWDNNFHQAIATATCNKLLISLFDTLNIVRRSTVWGQLRSTQLPPADHGSFAEHEAIYEAIVGRNPDLAADHMRSHLKSVRDRTFSAMEN
ncbi:FadR/GntR family transcriptional regulator [Candidatus Halocynthiibacter alkanivorans]|uniref:FadR/GntR family transcriptional regulator n=1 Tax=Candidatus Halocynthiibacter alkanivorans TaxID=2267619 RepID=UPI000DF31306|nr:FCD domain-containing protein [Candidatus Halocynthiibacter alkanivorans]